MPITIQPKQKKFTDDSYSKINTTIQETDSFKKKKINAMYDSGELIAYSNAIWSYMAKHPLNIEITTYNKKQSKEIHYVGYVTNLSWQTVQIIKGSYQDKFNGMVQIFNDYAEEKGYKLITKHFK